MKSALSNFKLATICALVAGLAVWQAKAAQSLDDLLRDALARYHHLYLERGNRDEFRDDRRPGWTPYLPLW